MRKRLIATTALLMCGLVQPTLAESSWSDLRSALYGETALLSAGDAVRIDMPYRTMDDARTRIQASVAAPDGTQIDRITVILDENPMPVSAVFDLARPLPAFAFDVTMRVNGPTPVHVVATTTDGRHLVSETFIKTSGSGACAAPPGTDPEEALATLGQMRLDITHADPVTRLTATEAQQRTLNVSMMHPSHSGMQMDQISLLFIPMRYVQTLDVQLDAEPFVSVTGSISLSENPDLSISIPAAAQTVSVTLTDTDGTVNTARASVAGL